MQLFSLTKKIITYFQIFLIFILPVFLLFLGVIGLKYRMIVLCFMCVCIYGIIMHEKLGKKDIGLIRPVSTYLVPYIIYTAIAVTFVVIYAHLVNFSPIHAWWKNPHFWLLFVVISAFQEFAYRGFLTILLKRVISNVHVEILVNAFLFTLLHIIFPHLGVVLPLAFLGGIFFSFLYYKYPNLWLISLSHSVLNFLVLYYGFFLLSL